MSGSDHRRARELAGLSLDDVLANQKRCCSSTAAPPPPLDIIKEDESNKKERRSWKVFKDKLRLKRQGSVWISSIHFPISDVPIANSLRSKTRTHPNSVMSTHYMAHQVEDLDPAALDSGSPAKSPATSPQFSLLGSTRFAGDNSDNAAGTLRRQLSRRNSANVSSEPYRPGRVVTFRNEEEEEEDGERQRAGRALSAREAVAAQEAAEAAAAQEAAEQAPATMSLMDLLEETDREMGLEGSRYILSDEDDDDDFDEDCEGAMEHTCCVCMVRHKASVSIPCGHTFCRMCSRELMVSRGNCTLCNNFILEILHIF